MLNIHNNSGQNVQLSVIVTIFALESSKEVESSYHGQRIIVAITGAWELHTNSKTADIGIIVFPKCVGTSQLPKFGKRYGLRTGN